MGAFLIVTMTCGGNMLLPFAKVGEGEKMSSMRKSCFIQSAKRAPVEEYFFPSGDLETFICNSHSEGLTT